MPKQTLDLILKHYPLEKDKSLIIEAFEFAEAAHSGQKRLSGEDYIIHPARTALILSHLKLDAKTIAAALLHDVLDDTQVLPEQLEKKFGKEISLLVKGVSALGKLRLPKQKLEIPPIQKIADKPIDFEFENLRRMFFAMAEDIRVILIKLADRTNNMETLRFIPPEKQQRLALETMEIFAPLANRLGIKTIKTKLENLAFPYLYPKEYQWIVENAKEKHNSGREYLEKTKLIIQKRLEQEGIKILEIKGRMKSYFSLYRKVMKHGMNFEEIYDLLAVRIIVPNIKICYETLGAIHKYWHPLPGRIKDYIAFPKPNGYQSLHTTIFCEQGKIIEVQIRTLLMHEIAEHGVCAHWALKEKIDLKKDKDKFGWIQDLANWQKENKDAKEYFEGLKIDIFKNRILVFTPKGKVIELPEGACSIDFAYAVHSEIGDHCVGAKVNGKMVNLDQPLKNGDVIEIIVSENKKPSRDWLRIAKTNLAKSHIKKQVEFNFFTDLKNRFFPQKRPEPMVVKEPVKTVKSTKPSIIIGGKKDVAYFLAKCCKPKPNKEIAAYLTKAQGASIHLQNCQNLKRLKNRFPDKILEAKWFTP